jgi:hypothetical protein
VCLGEHNVRAGDILKGLFESEGTVNQNISDIKSILNESTETELGLRLHEQALKKLPENYSGKVEEYIALRTKESLDILDGVQAICAQLKDRVVRTLPRRNKSFKKKYPFFFED